MTLPGLFLREKIISSTSAEDTEQRITKNTFKYNKDTEKQGKSEYGNTAGKKKEVQTGDGLT